MTPGAREMQLRLAAVRRVLELSPEPLHVPLGVVFGPLSGDEYLREWSAHAERVAAGTTFAPATVYANIPFCARVCTFCLLSAEPLPRRSIVAAYVAALQKQVALFEPIVEGLRFGSLHVGGGTPTILDEESLDRVMAALRRLPLAHDAQIGVEAHPATATLGRLQVLRRHGVHRLSFGVETLTPAVLRAVGRDDQTAVRVRTAIANARRLGFAVNLDLLAGLPSETEQSWIDTVKGTLELQPDSLSVNRFLGENSALASFGYGPDEAEHRRADAMLAAADALIRQVAPPRWPEEPLAAPGFGTQYVWERGTEARRYFQDDMIGPVSTLALGHGALGHVFGRGFAVPAGTVADYVSALERGGHPDMRMAPIDERFEMAFFAAGEACRGELGAAVFERVFKRGLRATFGPEIDALLRSGLLVSRGERLAKPNRLDFQVTHLLAFLLRDARMLARQARALEGAELAGSRECEGEGLELTREGDVEALLSRWADEGARAVRIDVGEGLDGETATRLATASKSRRLAVQVRGSAQRALQEYRHARVEIPPSMLWVRIAIRASQASRGEQRLLVSSAPRSR
jgi:oxygen-independent coproporphyrinogen III oxidase